MSETKKKRLSSFEVMSKSVKFPLLEKLLMLLGRFSLPPEFKRQRQMWLLKENAEENGPTAAGTGGGGGGGRRWGDND